jgi:hypothetical protein
MLLPRSFICAVVFGVLACAPGSALAASGPRAVDFEAAVGAPRATAARTGDFVTPVRRAPRRFDLVGFRWRGNAGSVSIRVRRPDGWSEWLDVDTIGSTAGGGAESEPAWAGGADAYQVRMTHRPRAIRAHFVVVTGRAVARPARAAAGAPAIVPRSSWDPLNQCPPRETPSYGRVDMAIVHNTATANDYTALDSAAIVLAVCRYHRNANGWNDIGYNLLVDKYGQVFEGRAGGIDQPVIGAQAQGYNRFSTGISAIGTYSAVPLPAPGVQALSRALAWKLNLTGVPAQGTIAETSGGGKLNRYPAGTPVTLNRIAGHRDGDATDCPGNSLYAQLPSIRHQVAVDVAGLAPVARLTGLPGRTSVVFPTGTMVAGRLTVPDAGAGGRPIVVQRRAGAGWAPMAQATTSDDGSWSVRLAAGWTRTYRAYWGGDATHRATSTPPFTLTVVPNVTAQVGAARVRVGGVAVVTGTVGPAKPRVVVTVARKTRGAYRRATRVAVPAGGGRFRLAIRLRRGALYRFTVGSRADAHNPAGVAAPVFVRAVAGGVAASSGG